MPVITRRRAAAVTATVLLLAGAIGCSGDRGSHWRRGNLHTHSLWSDGDQFPEVAVKWYRDHGYDFVSVSDHNVLAEGERWVSVPALSALDTALAEYRRQLGADWVATRPESASGTQVRLRTFEEYAGRLATPAFLVIQAEEISDVFESLSLHLNATNIAELIAPQGGSSVATVLQRNIDAVLDQRRRTGRMVVPHVNHPNFGYAITAEDLIAVHGERFFEVYNGHPWVFSEGDSLHPTIDRMWDIILAARLRTGSGLLYGLAVDDAHNYGRFDSRQANPGRGWVMVRSRVLHTDSILAAMERGDFYASSGITLDAVAATPQSLSLRIRGEPGVTYVTEFVGTRRGFDTTFTAMPDVGGRAVTRHYSGDIGVVLAEVTGTEPAYRFAGDELYVRARVRSSKPKVNPVFEGEVERAWAQPVVPGEGAAGRTP